MLRVPYLLVGLYLYLLFQVFPKVSMYQTHFPDKKTEA